MPATSTTRKVSTSKTAASEQAQGQTLIRMFEEKFVEDTDSNLLGTIQIHLFRDNLPSITIDTVDGEPFPMKHINRMLPRLRKAIHITKRSKILNSRAQVKEESENA